MANHRDREEIKKLTGLSDEELDEQTAEAQEAVNMVRLLVNYWRAIMDAMDRGETDTALFMSATASTYVAELDDNSLRWMISAATKAIATKLRSEAALDDVDPVAAAEQLLRESSDG